MAEEIPPCAAATMVSLRGLGYSLDAAVADIVDNSISAGASRIWLDFAWQGPDSFVSILDDGRGMWLEQLIMALRIGGHGPNSARHSSDLGKFGFGLKTASFSQCKRLTVATLYQGQLHCRIWDLEYVQAQDRWLLQSEPSELASAQFRRLKELESGTLVVWEKLDRLAFDESDASQEHFYESIENVKKHLAMVFHRFLEGSGTASKLDILLGNAAGYAGLKPWNPFAENVFRTPSDLLQRPPAAVKLQGFVLPEPGTLTANKRDRIGGPSGWRKQQGIYVYRNNRVLVAGGWLGLGGRQWLQDEGHQTARISLEFTSASDEEWKIDIRKSQARPPVRFKRRLTQLARLVRDRALQASPRTRQGHAAASSGDGDAYFWQTNPSGELEINRKHPAVLEILSRWGKAAEDIEKLLCLIQGQVPTKLVWVQTPGEQGPLLAQAKKLFKSLCSDMSPSEALGILLLDARFSSIRGQLKELLKLD